MSNVADDFGRVVAEGGSAKTVPYLAAFVLHSLPTAADDKALQDFEGLLLSHVVSGDSGTSRLVTYWASVAHYLNSQSAVEVLLKGTPLLQGRVARIAYEKKPWWKGIKPATVVLSAAALFGALEVLTNRYDRLFAEPQLLVKASGHFDIVEGEDLRRTIVLRNQLATTGHNSIRVLASWQGRDEKTKTKGQLRLAEAEVPVLAGGDSRELMVEGVAPASGNYVMKIDAIAEAGWFRGRKAFEANVPFRVWPNLPEGRISHVKSYRDRARYELRVLVGRAANKGLDCALEIKGVPELRYERQFHSPVGGYKETWHSAGNGRLAISVLNWSTGPIEAMQDIQMDLNLAGTAETAWASLATNAALTCQPRTEKLDEPSS
jgi:hypothetical protein